MVQQKLKAKALLIDLDGTLVDSLDAFAEAAETALTAIGHNRALDNVGLEVARRLQLNLPLNEYFDQIKVDEGSRNRFLALFLQSFYKIAPNRTRLFSDVDKTLRILSGDFLLALITRRPVSKELVRLELERLHLAGYFNAIVTSLEVEKPTPSPDTVVKAAKELKVQVHDCIVVSDSGVDIQAGKSAGAKTVAVLSGLFGEEELRKEIPDRIIRDINCLPEHLQVIESG